MVSQKTLLAEELLVSKTNEEMLRNKVYIIRGQKVMLDFDLAEIYGYATKVFNRQVRRNIERFKGEDFMFQLTRREAEMISRCQIGTSIISPILQTTGVKGGRVYLPLAFTEQGIYMLATVLRGDLAVNQSRTLIRLFKSMKDYVFENQEVIDYKKNLQLAGQVMKNANEVSQIKQSVYLLGDQIASLNKQMESANKKLHDVVMRSDLSPVVLDFKNHDGQGDLIIMNGELLRASEVYIDIYSKARKSVIIVDNYISIKTLRHLQNLRAGVEITVFSDNTGRHLHLTDYADFRSERKDLEIEFIKIENKVHDRFIIIDYGTSNELVYHSGASEKDAGKKISVISRYDDELIKKKVDEIVEELSRNKRLELK